MTTAEVHFGPRLIAHPSGKLRGALTLKPSPAIERAKPLPGEPGAVYERALEQHAGLVRLLRYFGVETVTIDSISDDPEETAIADAAVAFENGALLMRPTAMGRRGEADRVESQFARIDVPIAGHIAPPGLFDGGDALLVGDVAFIGVGARGNALGREGFAAVARAHGYRTVNVALAPGVPALRSVAGVVAADTLVIAADKVDASAFAGFKTIVLERGEGFGAGVVCLSERHVLADLRYRSALTQLRKAGIVAEAIDLYEFTKVGITPSRLVVDLKRD